MLKIVLVFFILSCKCGSGFEVHELQEFGERVRNLSLDLFHYTELETEGHVVMAPYTIWNLISLVAFSASAGSWDQFYSTIGISRRNEQNFNSIYKHITNLLLRKTARVSFETKLIVFYDANIELSGAFTRSIMNSGAHLKMLYFDDNGATALANDYIRLPGNLRLRRKMFNRADFENSSMIVSGIVEFKGEWFVPFVESNTIMNDGYNGSYYMMRQRARVYSGDIEMLSASAMELVLGEVGDFSMLIIRPHENVPLKNVIKNLVKMSIPNIVHQLYRHGLREMDIELPKFSLSSVLVLNNPLISMGIMNVFEPEQANFSELSKSDDMYIYNFEHRAVVMVSEKGVVARAFTPANSANRTREPDVGTGPPFLFLILHGPTMSIIFCGKYGE